jgi:transcriptional regulator with PAS, ATPase and Fis domain
MTVAEDSSKDPTRAAWLAVSAAFQALGRVFVCIDSEFRVIHASALLDQLLGAGAAQAVAGKRVEELLGPELFGRGGPVRQALERGERREGWGATLRESDSGPRRQVSISAAPFCQPEEGVCDPRVTYVLVLRPAEEAPAEPGQPVAFEGLLARSASMARIFALIENLEHSDATVLVAGESGTGKEMVARAIHRRSPRRGGAFVAVNCGALPGELLESELFGHVRGSFTGATRDRTGRFELAAGGTLFLDEVGDLPLSLQVKLLRVLQERTFERVGESHSRRTDARIIAATNVDLRRAVAEGRFREDLYYRLRVVPIEIAPLRERREDIEPLAQLLLARVASKQRRSLRFSPDALRAILGYPWPGNVREVENALEYAVAVCKGQTIGVEDLPVEISSPVSLPPKPVPATPGSEAERLREALAAHHWSREAAARSLGISRTTLWRRMRETGLADSER